METTAINKPLYDAFKEANVSEEKATAAAKAVLSNVETAATKADLKVIDAKLTIVLWVMSLGFGVLILDALSRMLG